MLNVVSIIATQKTFRQYTQKKMKHGLQNGKQKTEKQRKIIKKKTKREN